MYKAYKYRIYPNKQQKELIRKTFGCCRFVYNQTLAYKKELYEKEEKSVSKIDCNNYCNRELKKTYEWLREVDKFALTNAIYNMDSAYQKFFKEHAGYPKFKSKHDNHKSYTTNFSNGNIAVDFERGKVKLPRIKKIKAKLHRRFNGKIKSATVSQVPSGKYYVSILVETDHEELPHETDEFKIYSLENGRKYKVYKNGRVFREEYDLTDSTGRTRHFNEIEVKPSLNTNGYYELNIGGRSGENGCSIGLSHFVGLKMRISLKP